MLVHHTYKISISFQSLVVSYVGEWVVTFLKRPSKVLFTNLKNGFLFFFFISLLSLYRSKAFEATLERHSPAGKTNEQFQHHVPTLLYLLYFNYTTRHHTFSVSPFYSLFPSLHYLFPLFSFATFWGVGMEWRWLEIKRKSGIFSKL